MMKIQNIKQEIAGRSNPQKLVRGNPVNLDAQTAGSAKLLDIMQKNTGLSSACPWYSRKQLRRIERIRVRTYKYGHDNIRGSSLNRSGISSGDIVNGIANNMEAIL